MSNKRPIRIGMFVDRFPMLSETFIVEQIRYLLSEKNDVRIFPAWPDRNWRGDSTCAEDLLSRVEMCAAPARVSARLMRVCRLVAQGSWTSKIVRQVFIPPNESWQTVVGGYSICRWAPYVRKFDVIHAHFGPVAIVACDLLRRGFLGGAPLVTSFHGYDLTPNDIESYLHLFAFGAAFTVNSAYSREKLIRLGCPSSKIHLLPMGTDTRFFSTSSRINHGPSELIRLIFVGRLIELKGADIAIRALARGSQSAELIIIGDGPCLPELKKLSQDLGVARRVSFLGAVNHERVREEMEKADIFIYSGRRDEAGREEAQGVVIQEAQSMGLPVIVSRVGGAHEGLIDGETGFVVEAGNVDGFTEKIELLYWNPELRARMGNAGREFVLKRYDIRQIGEHLLDLYNKIMRRGGLQ